MHEEREWGLDWLWCKQLSQRCEKGGRADGAWSVMQSFISETGTPSHRQNWKKETLTHKKKLTYRCLFSDPVPDAPAKTVWVVDECFQDDVTVSFVKLANQRCTIIQTNTTIVSVSLLQIAKAGYKVQETD